SIFSISSARAISNTGTAPVGAPSCRWISVAALSGDVAASSTAMRSRSSFVTLKSPAPEGLDHVVDDTPFRFFQITRQPEHASKFLISICGVDIFSDQIGNRHAEMVGEALDHLE